MENNMNSYKKRDRELNMQHLASFGSLLKTARLKKGLTQTDVQRLLGLSSSGVVSHWEKDKSFMSNDNAKELARIYSIDEDELMYRLFQAKSLEPALNKWRQQSRGCRAVWRLLRECDERRSPLMLSRSEAEIG